jgi:hypothetical protein
MNLYYDRIEFKTEDCLYEKEKSGIKNNTVRVLKGDEKFHFLNNISALKHIKICKKDLSEYFERELQDISMFGELIIFTCKH